MFSFKSMVITAAVMTAGLVADSAPASAQCGGSQPSMTRGYSAPYAGSNQVYRYRSGYQFGGSSVPTGRYGYSARVYGSPGFVSEQSAYRRSLGKPF